MPERKDLPYCTLIINPEGPVLGIAPKAGGADPLPLIEQDGHVFKDLARQGQLLPYEDWRLSERSGPVIWPGGFPVRKWPA